MECVLLSLSVEILAGLDGAKLIYIFFPWKVKVVDLVEASKSLIAGSVLCASETRIRTTRLGVWSFEALPQRVWSFVGLIGSTVSVWRFWQGCGWRRANLWKVKFVDLVEASKCHIAGSVLCSRDTDSTNTLGVWSLELCHKEFGWIDWEHCFRAEVFGRTVDGDAMLVVCEVAWTHRRLEELVEPPRSHFKESVLPRYIHIKQTAQCNGVKMVEVDFAMRAK